MNANFDNKRIRRHSMTDDKMIPPTKRNSYLEFVNRYGLVKFQEKVKSPKLEPRQLMFDHFSKLSNPKLMAQQNSIKSFLSEKIDSYRKDSEHEVSEDENRNSFQEKSFRPKAIPFQKLKSSEKVQSRRRSVDLNSSSDVLKLFENVLF